MIKKMIIKLKATIGRQIAKRQDSWDAIHRLNGLDSTNFEFGEYRLKKQLLSHYEVNVYCVASYQVTLYKNGELIELCEVFPNGGLINSKDLNYVLKHIPFLEDVYLGRKALNVELRENEMI